MADADIWDRITYARDRALEAERTERQRIKDAENKDIQEAAGQMRQATPAGVQGGSE